MKTSATNSVVSLGDYIVLQRQKYTKLQKISNLDSTAMLGREQLELKGLLEKPYSATFKMRPKESIEPQGKRGRNQRLYTLELCSEVDMRSIREVLGISASGADNRHIIDDGDSQALRPDEIEELREKCGESTKIIEKIVENSKTFHAKTEYSQEKYLKKKEKKYFEFVQIRKPTIRLLTEIYYRQDADKIMGIRFDTLSQIISYAGLSAYGNYLMYESGSSGLLPASFLNSIGSNTEAKVVHMHPGNEPQRQAILALNLPEEQLQRCISVNIYSVLREFYQNNDVLEPTASTEADEKEPTCKKVKLSTDGAVSGTSDTSAADINADPMVSTNQRWQFDNRRACALMNDKFDSLLVASKEDPSNIVKTLLDFVKPSRPIVVFSLCKEALMELYVDLKTNSKVTNLHLTSNWLRHYQILPDRSHPEVNMNGNSGYILTGYTLA